MAVNDVRPDSRARRSRVTDDPCKTHQCRIQCHKIFQRCHPHTPLQHIILRKICKVVCYFIKICLLSQKKLILLKLTVNITTTPQFNLISPLAFLGGIFVIYLFVADAAVRTVTDVHISCRTGNLIILDGLLCQECQGQHFPMTAGSTSRSVYIQF